MISRMGQKDELASDTLSVALGGKGLRRMDCKGCVMACLPFAGNVARKSAVSCVPRILYVMILSYCDTQPKLLDSLLTFTTLGGLGCCCEELACDSNSKTICVRPPHERMPYFPALGNG